MRVFLFCKWCVFLLLIVCTALLASPYLCVLRLVVPDKSAAFHEELGKQLARNCAVDFSRLKRR